MYIIIRFYSRIDTNLKPHFCIFFLLEKYINVNVNLSYLLYFIDLRLSIPN